jgi:hypothetical protein
MIPVIKEMIIPSPTSQIETPLLGSLTNCKSLYSPAPSDMGVANQKLNRAAESRFKPKYSPAVMVIPEREVPGTNAST